MSDVSAPDLLFHNGDVLGHLDGDRPVTAVAVTGNRISATGGIELLEAATTSTTVIDLDGRSLVPGINDGHIHIGGFSQGRPPASLDVTPPTCPTIRSVADAVAARVAEIRPGDWIRGRGWVGASLADLDGTEPTATMLDAAAPDNPVVLTDFSGHAIWVNTAAMETAGLRHDTPVPIGGLARRDGAGDFTGLFVDAAQQLIVAHVPVLSDDELEAAVRSGLGALHAQGITSITDAALNPFPGMEDSLGGARIYELLRRLCNRNDVPMRCNVLVTFSPLGATMLDATIAGFEGWSAPESDDEWFSVRGLKVFADGVPPSCTAWVSQPYPDGSHGCLTVGGTTDDERVEELAGIIRAGHERGLQVGVHATGDRTVDAVLDGFATAQSDIPRTDPRHYIIHGPLATADMISRAASLGLGFNVQPSLKSTSARSIEGLFGRELSEWQWPLRAILDSGAVLAASSDAPVCEPNWRHGVAGAVLRETADGEVYGASQRIAVGEALDAYTAAGAWQDDCDSWKGRIAPGMVADLCVVDARLSSDDPRTFADSTVALTLVDGITVHDQLSA